MMHRPFFAALLLVAPANLSQAQTMSTEQARMMAAGYKAQFICSGLWNAQKSMADIEADELTGIYAELASLVPTLKPKIDQKKRRVSVPYAPGKSPRIAVHNHVTGCTALPINPKTEALLNRDKRVASNAFAAEAWPMGDANASRDGPAGFNTYEKLMAEVYETARFGGKSSSMLVVRNSAIVGEFYKPGHNRNTSQRTWSVAKSIAATFAGYVQQKAGQNVATLSARADAPGVKVDHLLRMSSGFDTMGPGNRSDQIYLGAGTVDDWATRGKRLHAAGTRFNYANNDTLTATLRLREAAHTLYPHTMFDKLGMTHTIAETDWKGNYILSSQVWTTARDLSRLGLLYLNDGVWAGERILPEGWRDYVTTPSGPQPDGKFGYGASFWLMNKSEGVPKDTFAAFGNRGQFLVIIPSLKMVIVRQGYDNLESQFDIAAFTKAVVAVAEAK